jgi:hypothetical protein
MTKTFKKKLESLHRKLWDKSDDGEITDHKIEMIIQLEAGLTVVDKYLEALQDYDRIERITETDSYVITEPEASLKEGGGDTVQKRIRLPENLSETAEQHGLDLTKLLTEAITQELSSRRSYIRETIGEDLTDAEAEFTFEIYKQGLELIKGDEQKRAQRARNRRNIYRGHFEETDTDHIEELRQIAAKISERF